MTYYKRLISRTGFDKEGGRVVSPGGNRHGTLQSGSSHGNYKSRSGFTLIEVLVALAIMVILFALLFAPMMAGLDWVSTGRASVNLQDAARFAMEHVRRELGEAVYVYPTRGAHFGFGDVKNHSEVLFIPPARDSLGRIIDPPRARVENGAKVAIKYSVQLIDPASKLSVANPFVLWRQEFLVRPNSLLPEGYELGSIDNVSGAWVPDVPLAENALTPKRSITFMPTATTCKDCANQMDGYATACTVCSSTNLMYMFAGMKFLPQRFEREQIKSSNGILYKAKHGSWDGTSIGDSFMSNVKYHNWWGDLLFSLRQWDPVTDRYSDIPRMDNFNINALPHRPVQVRWNSDRGEIICGSMPGHWNGDTWEEDLYRVVGYSVGTAANAWYNLNLTGATEITPIYPGDTAVAPADSGNAPISLIIDPTVGGTLEPAVIDPDSVKVKAIVTTGTQMLEKELRLTSNYEQPSIRGDEFNVRVFRSWTDSNLNGIQDAGESINGTKAELRFSRWDPPRPTSLALFPDVTGITSFQLIVTWYERRNYVYDPQYDAAGKDPFVSDAVVVDYSTRAIQNITLSLQKYMELEQVSPNLYRLPVDEAPAEVTVRERLTLKNFGN